MNTLIAITLVPAIAVLLGWSACILICGHLEERESGKRVDQARQELLAAEDRAWGRR